MDPFIPMRWMKRIVVFAAGAKMVDYAEAFNTEDYNQPNPELVERIRLEEESRGLRVPPKDPSAPDIELPAS